MKDTIKALAKELHIPETGIAPLPLPSEAYDRINGPHLCPFTTGTPEERMRGGTQLDNPRSAIVCLFPYYVPYEGPYNIPRYAWGEDYHLVVRRYLSRFVEALAQLYPTAQFEIHCDTSPLTDRYIAYLAGLGFYGWNKSLIHPTWGTYTSIGTIITDLAIEPDTPMEETCYGCGACVKFCPGNSLGGEVFYYETCKSYLTQLKGDLTLEEESIISKNPLIFGCDTCQDVCPHNRHVPPTPIPEFQTCEPYVEVASLESMTNKEFKAAYGHRAFSWRGKAILLRNHQYIHKKKP